MEKLTKQVEEAIREAIKLEINGRKFFNYAADVTHHERGKNMFRHLAQEEVKHLDIFGDIFTKLLGSEEWKTFVNAQTVSGTSPLVEKLKERMKNAAGKGETEALSIGMELESEAIAFFQKASSEAGDSKAAKIFWDIAEEEKYHYDLLQAQYDSVMRTGNWLSGAEFQMDGKW
jgi:rubrerythrin